MKDYELAYIAGLADGEAYIGIQRQMAKNGRTPNYALRFEIGMTDRQPLDYINGLIPKAKIIRVAAKGRRIPFYRLRFYRQEALKLLKDILPYLQAKKEQVRICIEIDELRQRYSPSKVHTGKPKFQPMPEEFVRKAEVLYWHLRSLHLNKKPRNKTAVQRFF